MKNNENLPSRNSQLSDTKSNIKSQPTKMPNSNEPVTRRVMRSGNHHIRRKSHEGAHEHNQSKKKKNKSTSSRKRKRKKTQTSPTQEPTQETTKSSPRTPETTSASKKKGSSKTKSPTRTPETTSSSKKKGSSKTKSPTRTPETTPTEEPTKTPIAIESSPELQDDLDHDSDESSNSNDGSIESEDSHESQANELDKEFIADLDEDADDDEMSYHQETMELKKDHVYEPGDLQEDVQDLLKKDEGEDRKISENYKKKNITREKNTDENYTSDKNTDEKDTDENYTSDKNTDDNETYDNSTDVEDQSGGIGQTDAREDDEGDEGKNIGSSSDESSSDSGSGEVEDMEHRDYIELVSDDDMPVAHNSLEWSSSQPYAGEIKSNTNKSELSYFVNKNIYQVACENIHSTRDFDKAYETNYNFLFKNCTMIEWNMFTADNFLEQIMGNYKEFDYEGKSPFHPYDFVKHIVFYLNLLTLRVLNGDKVPIETLIEKARKSRGIVEFICYKAVSDRVLKKFENHLSKADESFKNFYKTCHAQVARKRMKFENFVPETMNTSVCYFDIVHKFLQYYRGKQVTTRYKKKGDTKLSFEEFAQTGTFPDLMGKLIGPEVKHVNKRKLQHEEQGFIPEHDGITLKERGGTAYKGGDYSPVRKRSRKDNEKAKVTKEMVNKVVNANPGSALFWNRPMGEQFKKFKGYLVVKSESDETMLELIRVNVLDGDRNIEMLNPPEAFDVGTVQYENTKKNLKSTLL